MIHPKTGLVVGTVLLGLLLSTTALTTHASSYRVEMVLFEHLQPGGGGEAMPSSRLTISKERERTKRARPIIPISSLPLSKRIEKLVKGNIIHVISALSWNQNVIPKKQSTPLELDFLGDMTTLKPAPINNRLEGKVHLYRVGQVFQLSLSVDWSPPNSEPKRALNLGNRLQATFNPELFHLEEKRRVRLNEIHYMDTPRLGALVRVTRAK